MNKRKWTENERREANKKKIEYKKEKKKIFNELEKESATGAWGRTFTQIHKEIPNDEHPE